MDTILGAYQRRLEYETWRKRFVYILRKHEQGSGTYWVVTINIKISIINLNDNLIIWFAEPAAVYRKNC